MKPKPINEVRHLRLIPSDFDSLTESCGIDGTFQFGNTNDCPVFRCLKRMGHPVTSVSPSSITIAGVRSEGYNLYCDNIESARLKLLGGAKYAVIKL